MQVVPISGGVQILHNPQYWGLVASDSTVTPYVILKAFVFRWVNFYFERV